MLTRDTQSTDDTITLNQLLKSTHDVPEIESLHPKWAKKNDSRIYDCTTAQQEGYDLLFILYNKNVLFV